MTWISVDKPTVDKFYQPNVSDGWIHSDTGWCVVKTSGNSPHDYVYKLFTDTGEFVDEYEWIDENESYILTEIKNDIESD